ncbi:MAG: hypothetical protein ACI376_09380 [Candidatus Bruticola sp.]
MDKLRYWRRENAGALLAAERRVSYSARNSLHGLWLLLLLGGAITAAVLFFRSNISSMYDLPGGIWAEAVYWQQGISQKRCQAVGKAGGLKRKVIYALSGERIGAPKAGEFKQFASFEVKNSDFYYWYIHRGSPWVNNLLLNPMLSIFGRRYANVIFILGVLFCNGAAAVWLFTTLERSWPGLVVGALTFMFNPLTLAALQALNWEWACLAGLAAGMVLAVKMWRHQPVSWWQLSLVLAASAFFCGYYALLLLIVWGITYLAIYVSQRKMIAFRQDYIGVAAALAAWAFYLLPASCYSLSLKWIGYNPRAFFTVGGILAIWWIFNWVFSLKERTQEKKNSLAILFICLLLPVAGRAGFIVSGIFLAFGSSILLSSAPEIFAVRSSEKAALVAVVLIASFWGLLEWGQFSPLGGLNSNLAPVYNVFSGVDEFKNKKILELPFSAQPLGLFAQTTHGLPLVSRANLLTEAGVTAPGYAEFCQLLDDLGQNSINKNQNFAILIDNKNMRENAWAELRKRGIHFIILHERGCAHVEMQSGTFSGSVFFRDYLMLYNLLGVPLVDDFEPLSKGRWGWPAPDKREIAWNRMAVFVVPQVDGTKKLVD